MRAESRLFFFTVWRRFCATSKPPRSYASFFKYTKALSEASGGLNKLRKKMLIEWEELPVLGRVYISQEGINAQVTFPLHSGPDLQKAVRGLPGLDDVNIIEHSLEDSMSLFKSLHVRIREQLVADGIEKGKVDPTVSMGRLSPSEWHEALQKREGQSGEEQRPVLIDVRNYYESRIGTFPGSIPMGTETHRSACSSVDKIVADLPSSTPLMLYCTGGIRCEKMAGYLTQMKGFSNVKSLQGGILAYTTQFPGKQSLFKGVNFTFDGRLVSRVTEDVLAECDQCGVLFDAYANCAYCDLLFIQCSECKERFKGCCSDECIQIKESLLPEQRRALTTRLRQLCKLPGNPGFLRPTLQQRQAVTYLTELSNLNHDFAPSSSGLNAGEPLKVDST